MTAEGRPLPEGWVETTVGDVVDDFQNGLSKRRSDEGRRIPVLRLADVEGDGLGQGDARQIALSDDEIEKYGIGPGDLIITRVNGSAAKVGRAFEWRTEDLWAYCDHFIRARLSAAVLPAFAEFSLSKPSTRRIIEASFVSSAGQKTVSQGTLANLPLAVPPLAEQRRIVEKIEALTARSRRAREALEALPALLDRYRASVLAAAFRGDLTKDWREGRAELGSLRSSFGLPAEEHSDPDARPVSIPASWEWARLEEIADVKGGLAKGKKRKQDTALVDVPYLRVANVQRGYLDLTEVKEIPATDDEIEALMLQPGDILFNEGGDRDKLGRGWVWEGQIDRCIHQNHVFRARLRGRNINPYLLSMYGNTFGQSYFFGAGTQSVNLASISLSKLRAFPVPLIPQDEQAVLLERVTKALAWADSLQAKLAGARENVTTLDQSILAKAFRGELVPQDPTDESASALLERIRARRAAEEAAPKRGRRKAG